MGEPITVDIPHKAGRVGARDRIEKGLGKIAQIVPGGAITERHWDGDTLVFTLEAMGQRVASRLEVFEDKVHAIVDLPPMLSLFAGKIRTALLDSGTKMLK